ncbi:MAG: hypothetical protein ACHREM_24405 [Polyangiales bacterium]
MGDKVEIRVAGLSWNGRTLRALLVRCDRARAGCGDIASGLSFDLLFEDGTEGAGGVLDVEGLEAALNVYDVSDPIAPDAP